MTLTGYEFLLSSLNVDRSLSSFAESFRFFVRWKTRYFEVFGKLSAVPRKKLRPVAVFLSFEVLACRRLESKSLKLSSRLITNLDHISGVRVGAIRFRPSTLEMISILHSSTLIPYVHTGQFRLLETGSFCGSSSPVIVERDLKMNVMQKKCAHSKRKGEREWLRLYSYHF